MERIPDTKLIPLTQGKFAIVDAEDYDQFSQDKWFAKRRRGWVYAARTTSRSTPQRRTVWMHREIINASKGMMCDHKDHNGLNNSKSNLRLCTNSQNQQNQKPRTTGTSKYKGVNWHKNNKWQARIGFNGRRIYLGLFDNQIDAAVAYDRKAVELFGEFACLNFPQLIEFRKRLKKLIWAA